MIIKIGFTYIMSNIGRNVFYVGVTNSIQRRSIEHFEGKGGQFTSKYNCRHLVYFETFRSIVDAIQREKELKNRNRQWKIDLIRSVNPSMKDLAEDWRV